MGLAEWKGRVVLRVGEALEPTSGATAEDIARSVDREILARVQLFPVNYLALADLNEAPYVELARQYRDTLAKISKSDHKQYVQRRARCPDELLPFWLKMYANPILNIHNLGLDNLACPEDRRLPVAASRGTGSR